MTTILDEDGWDDPEEADVAEPTDDALREARDRASRADRACRSALMADDDDWRVRRAGEAVDLLREALALLDA